MVRVITKAPSVLVNDASEADFRTKNNLDLQGATSPVDQDLTRSLRLGWPYKPGLWSL